MTRNENSVYSLQSRCFPCVHKLSVLALPQWSRFAAMLPCEMWEGKVWKQKRRNVLFLLHHQPPPPPPPSLPTYSSFKQTIATFRCNISQHYWAQHVVRVWPPCCNVRRHAECSLVSSGFKMVKFNLKMTQFPQQVSLFTCLILVGGGIITVRLNESVVLYVRVISKVISTSFLWLE